MRLIRESPAAFRAVGDVITLGAAEIETVRAAVHDAPLGRVRINLHPDNDDALHEMFIALGRTSYVRPHRHVRKSESFHLISGRLDVVVFDDFGTITEIFPLCAPTDAADTPAPPPFYYRMSRPQFHTVRVRSEIAIVHEITNGPFTADGTIYADFAPAPGDNDAVREFCAAVDRACAAPAAIAR